jgi:F0F1-type ATP synthase membrane subunit b/b'
MEEYLLPITIVLIAFGVFQLILMVKLWNMTGDVRLIRENLVKKEEELNKKISDQPEEILRTLRSQMEELNKKISDQVFSINDLVISKVSGKQLRIKEIDGDHYKCWSGGGTYFVGSFLENELEKIKEE